MSLVEKVDHGEQHIHCGQCGAGWARSEWSIYQVFDPEDASNLWSSDDMVKHSKQALWDFFSHISSVTCYECPNECRYLDGWDDIVFFDNGVYLCPDCQYPQEYPHDAWACCRGNNWKHTEGDACQELIGGDIKNNRAKCQCHEDCEFWICVVPDCHMALYSGQGHQHDNVRVPARPNDVLPTMVPVTNPYVPCGPYGGQAVNTVTFTMGDVTPVPPKLDLECTICGIYCCSLHKTHAAKHQFCWAE